MRRFTEMLREYNENVRDKLQVAESFLNILIDGSRFGDYLTIILLLLYKLLDKKRKKRVEK